MESFTPISCANFVLLCVLFVNATAVPRTESDIQNTDYTVTLPPECIGKELCSVKPIDYPTAIMEREAELLVKRSRRQSIREPVTLRSDSNNCVESLQQIKPFVVVRNRTQHVVVQSSFYNQYVTGVTCRSAGAPCFESLNGHDLDSSQFYCETTNSAIYLTTYNFKLRKPELLRTTIPVGCACLKHHGLNV